MAVKMEHLKEDLLSVYYLMWLRVSIFVCQSEHRRDVLLIVETVRGWQGLWILGFEVFKMYFQSNAKENFGFSEILQTKTEVKLQSDDVVYISDDDDDDDECDVKKCKLADVISRDVPIIYITEDKEGEVPVSKQNKVNDKNLSENAFLISDITSRENSNTRQTESKISSEYESKIYKPNNRNVEILPATSTVNDIDVMMPMENNENNVIKPMENNESYVMMLMENNKSDVMMPMKDNESDVMMPMENNENNVMKPMENNESDVMMSMKDNESDVMKSIGDKDCDVNNRNNPKYMRNVGGITVKELCCSTGNMTKNIKDIYAQCSTAEDLKKLTQKDSNKTNDDQNKHQKQRPGNTNVKKSKEIKSSGVNRDKLSSDEIEISDIIMEKQKSGSAREKQKTRTEEEVQTSEKLGEKQMSETLRESEKMGEKQTSETLRESEKMGEKQTSETLRESEKMGEKQMSKILRESEKMGEKQMSETLREKENSCMTKTSKTSETKDSSGGNQHLIQQTEQRVLEKLEQEKAHGFGHKPFICKVCGKQYIKKSELKEHVKVHDMVKSSKKVTEHNQSDFMKKSHNKYECSICFRVFRSYENMKKHLNDHIKRKHPSKSESASSSSDSEISDSSDKSDREVSVKKSRNNFICNICNTVFRSKYLLLQHTKFVHTPDDDESSSGGESLNSSKYINKNAKNCFKQSLHSSRDKYQLRSSTANCSNKLKESHRCDMCKKKFHSQYSLSQHCNRMHGKIKRDVVDRLNRINKKVKSQYRPNKSTCFVCGLEFRNKNQLRWHARRHIGTMPFLCGYCGRLESSKKCLEMHWKIHERESKINVFTCSFCSKKFSSSKALDTHRNSVHGKNDKLEENSRNLMKKEKRALCDKHKCKLCNDVFTSSLSLRIHSRICTGSAKRNSLFSCNICDKQFVQKRNLNNHLKCHHVTEDCTESEGSSEDITSGMEMSNDSEQYQCDICDATFTVEKDLQIHLKTHKKSVKFIDISKSKKGILPYQCEICGICFLQKQNLESHMKNSTCCNGTKSVHKEEDSETETRRSPSLYIKCNFCDKSFEKINWLNYHLIVHRDEKLFRCSLCSKSFYNLSVLRWHHSSHFNNKAYQCDICNIKVFNAESLKIHKKIHDL
ncbi:hypothetical protein KUTeg_010844 [Tegillarca granosa]|uniref:C2H2-type domain-containing protein n=1 Tax=Tegillarca granosa TaxID=220873 RepID=A0ABQ9F2D9_TEGGR|nr:hypothetical protein KUTeg_010844 [Tegillarca granosa]